MAEAIEQIVASTMASLRASDVNDLGSVTEVKSGQAMSSARNRKSPADAK
jgi:hypothetical protein